MDSYGQIVNIIALTLGAAWGPYAACSALWGCAGSVEGQVVSLTAHARDVAVLRLE